MYVITWRRESGDPGSAVALFTSCSLSGRDSAKMSKKRPKTTASRNLRAVIDEQLTAAALEIFQLLRESADTDVVTLKELVTERVTAAVETIFTVFQASRADRAAEDPGELLGVEQTLKPQVL